jgi:elongation factor 1-beta
MADVVITLRIMPKDIHIDLLKVEKAAKVEIISYCNSREFKTSIVPIAFGLRALDIIFVMDESKGSTEKLEEKLRHIEGVESVEVTDVRRAIG